MKKAFYLLLCAVLVGLFAVPGNALRAQSKWLAAEQLPDLLKVLDPPPAFDSPAFANDLLRYQWGKQQRRDSVRCAIAKRDAVYGLATICSEFSVPFGMTLSPETTPEIYRLLDTAVATVDQVGKKAKAYYNRTRPYVYFGEPTIAPWDEEDLRHNGSYPSGHTILGWTAALLLAEINPDRQDTILRRGYLYGESRIIAGFHWSSDVDAGRLAATVALNRMRNEPRFQRQLQKAIAEFRLLSAAKREAEEGRR